MKRTYFLLAAICMVCTLTFAQHTPSGTITYQKFYEELAPHGTWINYPGYGEVWHPTVNGDFKPYSTNGYWENTDQGLYWHSNYDWGWAPFHYGNWFYDDSYGWLWEPGYEWSPAWVTWGDSDNYYAWAPTTPTAFVNTNGKPHNAYWNMVDRKDIYDRNLSSRLADENTLRRDAGKISLRNSSPDANEIGRYTQQHVPVRTLKTTNEPVRISGNTIDRNNEFPVYRPQVERSSTIHPTYSRSVEAQDINPIKENSEWPSNTYHTHTNNIERLPMHQANGIRTMPAGYEGQRR